MRMTKHDVAVVGIGQTKFKSKRRDVNIPEMIYEAVKMALDDAQLEPKDIDALVIGNMDHFEGINFSELMCGIEAAPGYLKPVVKVATGGTTGSSLAIRWSNNRNNYRFRSGMGASFSSGSTRSISSYGRHVFC